MDEKGAELIGMHVGDGTLYLANKTTLVWEMRGSIYEKEYYEYVSKLIEELLQIKLKPKYRGPNSYGIQTTNKTITGFFIKNGFNPGRKVYTVRIPDYIKNRKDVNVKHGFVRGLFDTDGCIRFDKNRTAHHYYPKIEFSFASENLVRDLVDLLNELGFKNHYWRDRTHLHLCIAGFYSLDKWIREISPANSKHLNRIRVGLANKDKVTLKKKSINLKSGQSSIETSPGGTAVTPKDC